MNSIERKKVSVITKYALDSFSESDWYTLGQITGKLKIINDHPRLFRALSFRDDDYEQCVTEVLDSIFSEECPLIPEVIDHFDIDLWFQQKNPEKYERIFNTSSTRSADFWREGYLRLFVSHISSNREKMSFLKASLANWGISAFIAHEDIEASREWREEVEAGLETMQVFAAVVEPGFKESDWCPQEVGYALGRKVDIIPLRAGLDPFGFFGKIQGIQIKGKIPENVASEIAELLLKKPKYRNDLIQSIAKAFSSLQSTPKTKLIQKLDSWSILTDEQIKTILERASLSVFEQRTLKNLIGRVDAFKAVATTLSQTEPDDDIPF
jgi:AbiJ N-terminal domain 5/TIR domain